MIGTFNLPLASTGSTMIGFITEWVVSGDSAARTIGLPLVNTRTEGSLSYDCVVYWGDNTSSTIKSWNDTNTAHTYASNGTYQVNIVGTCEGWAFNNGGDKLKITKIINFCGPNFNGFKRLKQGFYGCTNLTTMSGSGSIKPSDTGCLSEGFAQTFQDCTSLSAITTDLFRYNTGAASFCATFYNAPVTSIPNNLFKYNTLSTIFELCFDGSKITSISTDLFRYNTLATNFNSTFRSISTLLGLPADIFRYNIMATGFNACFMDCSALSGITADLFKYNTAATNMGYVFNGCTVLPTVNSDLFWYNTGVTTFQSVFQNCSKLQQHATIFCATGNTATRFLNQSPNFTGSFARSTFTGTQGAAPDLWNYNYDTGTPTPTSCWYGGGNSLTSLTNYASIPAGWN